MVSIERACHKDHACQYQCSIINSSEDMNQVKNFVTDRWTNKFKCPSAGDKNPMPFIERIPERTSFDKLYCVLISYIE